MLANPFDDASGVVPSFVGIEDDALKLLEGEHMGDELSGVVHLVGDRVLDLLALWTLHHASISNHITRRGKTIAAQGREIAEGLKTQGTAPGGDQCPPSVARYGLDASGGLAGIYATLSTGS